MPHLDPAWIALIGTLCGGLGLKLLEHWLGKSKAKFDESTKLRDELRTQMETLRQEQKDTEAELEKYKRDYYDLRDKYAEVSALYKVAVDQLKAELEKNKP